MERNREEPKGFQHVGRTFKGLWQGWGHLSFLSSFPYLQLLHAHIFTLLCQGSIPLQFINQRRFTLLWFLGYGEPQKQKRKREGRATREVETPLNAVGASRGKLRRRWLSTVNALFLRFHKRVPVDHTPSIPSATPA